MAFLAFPVNHIHIPSFTSSTYTNSSYPNSIGPNKEPFQAEMYGGNPRFSSSAEDDNVILHEPWPMPTNAGPNHCQPGCSILIHTEEEDKVRRFEFLGRRRSSRAGSFGSIRSLRSDGQSGGGVAGLIHDIKNPFSFGGGGGGGGGSAGAAKVDEIKEEPEKIEEDPTSKEEQEGEVGTDIGERQGRPGQPIRRCSLRFGNLPHRPPEMKRASSISLGVASRKMLLSEQNGSNTGASSQTGSGSSTLANGTTAGIPPTQSTQQWDRPGFNQSTRRRSASPEPVDIGEAITSGVKSLWKNVRSSVSQSPTSPPTRQSPSPNREQNRLERRGSAPPLTTLSSPPQSISGTVGETSSFGLPAVSEEPGVEAGIPSTRTEPLVADQPMDNRPEGQAGSANPKQLSDETEESERERLQAEPRMTSENTEQLDSVHIVPDSIQPSTLNPAIKHPDPAHRPPSPPPRTSDTEPLTPNTASSGTSLPSPTTPLTPAEKQDDAESVSSDVEAFFDAEMKWDETDLKPLSLHGVKPSSNHKSSSLTGQNPIEQDPGFKEDIEVGQHEFTGKGGMIRRASVGSSVSADEDGRSGERESAVLGFQRKIVDVGKKLNFGI